MRAIQRRGAEPGEHEVAGKIEERRAQEEDACAGAVDRVREVKIALHVGGREAYVHAVKIREDVQDEDVGDETPGDLAVELRGVYRWKGSGRGHFTNVTAVPIG